jgi:hypothetical protein
MACEVILFSSKNVYFSIKANRVIPLFEKKKKIKEKKRSVSSSSSSIPGKTHKQKATC